MKKRLQVRRSVYKVTARKKFPHPSAVSELEFTDSGHADSVIRGLIHSGYTVTIYEDTLWIDEDVLQNEHSNYRQLDEDGNVIAPNHEVYEQCDMKVVPPRR